MKKNLLFAVLFYSVCIASAQNTTLKTKVSKKAESLESKVIAWRRDFHQNPELGNREFKTGEKIALVFGNEVTGVEQTTIQQCKGCVEIPQLGMKHSLNIATAAGVVLWEIVRSRIQHKTQN